MTDTVKIERPLFCRRVEDLGGRVRPDPQGNPTKVKTRTHDLPQSVVEAWLNPRSA